MPQFLSPRIALIVCTKNRGKKLDPFFDSVRRLNHKGPWELVIVDSSTDDTAERLKAFAATLSNPVKIITELRSGLGLARNRGWRASSAPILAFSDDDCYPDPNFLNDVEAAFSEPSLGFLGGRILLHDPTDARITIYESLTEQPVAPGDFIGCGFIQGANMSFRLQTLEDINGFDDYLGAGTPFGCEDVDALLRALAAGWRGKYDPRPTVYHHHGRKPGQDVRSLMKGYTVGKAAYYTKCLLYMPQRRICLRHWLRGIQHQSFGQTRLELQSALRYLLHQFRRRPNVTY